VSIPTAAGNEAPPRVLGIEHCVVAVSDWERSNAFYRDVVGCEVVERAGGFVYRIGDQFLSVHGPGTDADHVARDPVRPGNSDLCFVWAGSIDAAVAHLTAQGVAIEAGPLAARGPLGRVGRHVYFRDPDGSLLEFVAYA
jgi:catechol 2,3-dioxygenase-like lactoylglutathione lyase family enzyme